MVILISGILPVILNSHLFLWRPKSLKTLTAIIEKGFLRFQISKRSVHWSGLTGARVLVVDDNSVNLYIASQYLKNWGLAHDTVDSSKAALKSV